MKQNRYERLQKYLAHCGFGSRRECDKMIAQGLVMVNGHVITDMGIKIDPESDYVSWDGKKINKHNTKSVYIILNKPKGCLSTRNDPQKRDTIYDLLPKHYRNVSHVGRLDFNTEGLILFTNDGDLAHFLTKPRSSIQKVYEVKVKGRPTPEKIKKLSKGIPLGKNITLPIVITFMKDTQTNSWFRVELREGKNRQIRKMFEIIQNPVLKLKRISLGPL